MNKSPNTLAWLGWVVAVIALVVPFMQYIDSHSLIEKKINDQPLYEHKITTFQKSNVPDDLIRILPKSVWDTKDLIRNEFSVTHKSGKSIRGLKVLFQTDKPIKNIALVNSTIGSKITYSNDRKEATLIKDELQPNQTITGYVVTEGITTVKYVVTAKEGALYEPSQNFG